VRLNSRTLPSCAEPNAHTLRARSPRLQCLAQHAGLRVNNELGLRPQYSLPSSSVLDCGLTLTRTVLEAAHHCPRSTTSLPSSSVLDCGLTLTRTVLEAAHRCPRSTTNPVRQVVVTALRRRTCEVRAILHAGKQSHSQGGVVHTEEGDVPYWAHCVSILRFLRKGKLSREEAKVWEGRNNGADGSEAVCARWQCDYAPRPSHTHISRLPPPYPLL